MTLLLTDVDSALQRWARDPGLPDVKHKDSEGPFQPELQCLVPLGIIISPQAYALDLDGYVRLDVDQYFALCVRLEP